MARLHPDVAVVLRHASLRVQEGHADAALGAQAGIVAAAVLYGLPVELVAEPGEQTEQSGKVEKQRLRCREDRGRRSAAAIGFNSFLTMHNRAFFLPVLGLQLFRLSALCARLVAAALPANDPAKIYVFNPGASGASTSQLEVKGGVITGTHLQPSCHELRY